MNKTLIGVLLFTSSHSMGQSINSENWTVNEIAQYTNLTKLANYVHGKKQSEISKDSLFEKYIYFDHILKDTVAQRKEERLAKFDGIFGFFTKTIDSIGLENLDAKPVRFYKNHKVYEPFNKELAMQSISGEKMYSKDANVFAYYKKEEPEKPLGTLLFEPETNKLEAWIMINQGGYSYFLTFNLF